MAGLRLSVLTKEFVRVTVKASEVGRPIDPSLAGTPEMAFVNLAEDEDRTPDEPDWNVGIWERFAGQIIAKCLVGPGGTIELPIGEYGIWVRFTVESETPALRVGSLTIE